METANSKPIHLWADFNGVFGDILCLSHKDYSLDEQGNQVQLREGMIVTAYTEDEEDGKPDNLVASGIVERSPEWLRCSGSRWCLRIDANGVRHESELRSK
jgi:hypothetical protein